MRRKEKKKAWIFFHFTLLGVAGEQNLPREHKCIYKEKEKKNREALLLAFKQTFTRCWCSSASLLTPHLHRVPAAWWCPPQVLFLQVPLSPSIAHATRCSKPTRCQKTYSEQHITSTKTRSFSYWKNKKKKKGCFCAAQKYQEHQRLLGSSHLLANSASAAAPRLQHPRVPALLLQQPPPPAPPQQQSSPATLVLSFPSAPHSYVCN